MTSSNRLSNTSPTWPTYTGHRSNRISLRSTASSLTPVCMGRRVFRDDGTTATVYVQSGQQTIANYTASSAPSSPTYRYVYASYIDESVLRFKPSGSESLYYHRNQQYSVVALTNASAAIVERYAYSAYGVPTITNASGTLLPVGSVDNRYLYTGREWDQTLSLYHYRARMYDANLGRFTSRDPIGYVDGFNLWVANFALSLSATDPDGLRQLAPPVRPMPTTGCGGRVPYNVPYPEWTPRVIPVWEIHRYSLSKRAKESISIGRPGVRPRIYNVLPNDPVQKKPRRKVWRRDVPKRPITGTPDPTKLRCTLIWGFEPVLPGRCWECWYMCPGSAPVWRWQPDGCHEDTDVVEGYMTHKGDEVGADGEPIVVEGEDDCEKNVDVTPLPIWNPNIQGQ